LLPSSVRFLGTSIYDINNNILIIFIIVLIVMLLSVSISMTLNDTNITELVFIDTFVVILFVLYGSVNNK